MARPEPDPAIDDYLAALGEARRAALQRVREIVRARMGENAEWRRTRGR